MSNIEFVLVTAIAIGIAAVAIVSDDDYVMNKQVDEAIEKKVSSVHTENYCDEDEYNDKEELVKQGTCYQYDRVVYATKVSDKLYDITIQINNKNVANYCFVKEK